MEPPPKKRTRLDDKRENKKGELDKSLSPRNRLWEQVVRIKSLFMPTSLFALAHRSLSFGRDNRQEQPPQQQSQQEPQQTSSSIPKRKRVSKRQKNEDQDKYFDQVVLSDCLEYVQSMPPEILRCTITCPPSNTRVIKNEDSAGWSNFVNKQVILLEQLYRVTKPGGHLWYVHKVQHHENDVFHPMSWLRKSPWFLRQEIVWDKLETPDTSSLKFWPTDQRIFWLRKEPGPQFSLSPFAFKWGNVWRWKYSDQHSFPIFLTLAILHASNLSKKSLVFDPYGRSGTTAKACQMLKYHFVTTETDELKLHKINDRLNQTTPEDKYWKSLASKQIANQTLNLRTFTESFEFIPK